MSRSWNLLHSLPKHATAANNIRNLRLVLWNLNCTWPDIVSRCMNVLELCNHLYPLALTKQRSPQGRACKFVVRCSNPHRFIFRLSFVEKRINRSPTSPTNQIASSRSSPQSAVPHSNSLAQRPKAQPQHAASPYLLSPAD